MNPRFRARSPFFLLRRTLLGAACLLGLSSAAWAQCPVAANCTPGNAPAGNVVFGGGIFQVSLGTINNTTLGAVEGYHDYSCTVGTVLTAGASYTLTVRTNANLAEVVKVWIDYDNNGVFNAASELFYSGTATGVHTGTNLLVPASATLGVPLRMRVAADLDIAALPTPCSTPEYSQTEDYAVTIQANTNPPVAAFDVQGNPVTCTGLVQFRDQSQNSPTSWLWNFGDTQTSTQQNPVHQYAAPGTYTVSLTATNALGSNTVTRTNYVVYNNSLPVAASCTPQTSAYCCNFGVARVRMSTMDNVSADGSAGYQDFTCTNRIRVVVGNTYRLAVYASGSAAHDIRAWLDFNNDGQFATSELVLTGLNKTADSVLVNIPTNTPLQALRLRVIADATGNASGPCQAPQLGQAEDYTVDVQANTQPPLVDFTVDTRTVCDTVVQFRDRSQSGPTSWRWDFGDNSAASTLQNPIHIYHQSGTYTVKLVAANQFGTDSLIKQNFITISNPCLNYCIPDNLQTQSIWISRVQFADIDRSSGLDSSGYINTGATAHVLQGTTETLNVEVTSQQAPVFVVAAWIDYNHSGTWEQTERVAFGQAQSGQPFSVTVTIPGSARLGATQMRILSSRNGQFAQNPCPPNGAQGLEVEDYTVVISAQQLPPTVDFTSDVRLSCTGLIQFTDLSSNAPTGWRWDFGDGQFSTQQNPSHQYPTTAATYPVKLIATNQFGTDSLRRTAYIVVTGGAAPRPAVCTPQSTNPGNGMGINTVILGTLRNTSANQADGYRDYSCTSRVTLREGSSYTLQVNTIQQNPRGVNVNAWLDSNDDGQFDPIDEVIMTTTGNTHTVTFVAPTPAAYLVPLRLRVGSDWGGNPAPTPCGNVQFGQFEDYSVLIDHPLATAADRAPLALSLVPNPAPNGRVAVRLTGNAATAGPVSVTVRTVLGQVVARRQLTLTAGTDAALSLDTLPRGVYVVTFDSPTAALRGTTRLILD